MIAFLCVVVLAVLALTKTLNPQTRHRPVWWAVLVVSASVSIFVGVPLVSWYRTATASNRAELSIPLDARKLGAKTEVEFAMPAGEYVVVARLRKEAAAQAPHARIRYVVEAKEDGVRLESEAELNFASLNLREIRLKSVTLTRSNQPVHVTVEVASPGGNEIWFALVKQPLLP